MHSESNERTHIIYTHAIDPHTGLPQGQTCKDRRNPDVTSPDAPRAPLPSLLLPSWENAGEDNYKRKKQKKKRGKRATGTWMSKDNLTLPAGINNRNPQKISNQNPENKENPGTSKNLNIAPHSNRDCPMDEAVRTRGLPQKRLETLEPDYLQSPVGNYNNSLPMEKSQQCDTVTQKPGHLTATETGAKNTINKNIAVMTNTRASLIGPLRKKTEREK